MRRESIKVIFDTNIWIGFLIGRQPAYLKDLIVNKQITIITTDLLITEIIKVTSRKKLSKYFSSSSVKDLLEFLEIISVHKKIRPKYKLARDPKDNFLLDLIEASNADFLVTGDKDLLELNPFKTASIVTPAQFEFEIKKIIT